MSRKDYMKAADHLNTRRMATRNQRREEVEITANFLADMFAADNPRFDRKQFMQATGFTTKANGA